KPKIGAANDAKSDSVKVKNAELVGFGSEPFAHCGMGYVSTRVGAGAALRQHTYPSQAMQVLHWPRKELNVPMAGPMDHYDYVSDDGTTYRVRLAKDEADRVGNTVATAAHASLPKGMKPRKRFYRDPGTGRERGIVVGAITQAAWTEAVGTESTLAGSRLRANISASNRRAI